VFDYARACKREEGWRRKRGGREAEVVEGGGRCIEVLEAGSKGGRLVSKAGT
jgi:hypothetical protein